MNLLRCVLKCIQASLTFFVIFYLTLHYSMQYIFLKIPEMCIVEESYFRVTFFGMHG
jgi:hypothetical protein